MNEDEVIRALGALAQETRLRIFRMLVVAGPRGMQPGQLAEELGIASTALSFHLKELLHAGLASSERSGRHLIYRARFDRMNGLLGFLTAHCCEGQPCEVNAVDCTDCS
ncbi:MAG: metalloregulator ArsR/SmtB family transcription factor [Hydrogenophaga sp.]|jgi:ArsR family transcriptional regulator, arsenate/arsenite/antimonite-responsive transcriptional repressor|uniref:ArsR/SmtB family transcription factor n=1 Tax=Hydrogenophaga sp. TaxID=1904254 RepID=UPI00260A1005|nr:metalloregulator ArsR/SmtB family transcription factor [Hydrogenophaga sp.]MCV0437894.1 metalloregulator ArsR/SmtB family transcription factor [Hydrogenophaga sp.]